MERPVCAPWCVFLPWSPLYTLLTDKIKFKNELNRFMSHLRPQWGEGTGSGCRLLSRPAPWLRVRGGDAGSVPKTFVSRTRVIIATWTQWLEIEGGEKSVQDTRLISLLSISTSYSSPAGLGSSPGEVRATEPSEPLTGNTYKFLQQHLRSV